MIAINRLSEESPVQRYALLLLRLHKLIAKGKGDDAEANDLRDLMDLPWYEMGAEDARLVRQLSADFYTLDSGAPSNHPPNDLFEREVANELDHARSEHDFIRALKILGDRASEIGRYRATSLRGYCYVSLGLPEVAFQFFERAVQFASDQEAAEIQLVLALAKFGETRSASRRILHRLRTSQTISVDFHRIAASVLIGHATYVRGASQKKYAALAEREYQFLVDLPGVFAIAPEVAALRLEGYIGLSETYYLMGQERKAIESANSALSIDPDNEFVLVYRGLLTCSSEFIDSKKYFERAVALHTSSVWPYYYLAFDALRKGEYERCIELALQGLDCLTTPEIHAGFHEWVAISLASRGAIDSKPPVDAIRRHFRIAMILDPKSRRLVLNRDKFERTVGALNGNGIRWKLQRPIDPSIASRREILAHRKSAAQSISV